MIINNQYKFIYVHVPRTGGKSIREMWKRDVSKEFKQHATYPMVLKRRGNHYNDYFSFGFIRNPWERVFSLFCKHVKNSPVDTSKGFKYWLFDETRTDSQRHKQPALYFLKGVDYIARFENFEKEWDYIFNRLGLTRIKIPHINRGREGQSYQDLYDKEMNNFILKYHREDIEYGRYNY